MLSRCNFADRLETLSLQSCSSASRSNASCMVKPARMICDLISFLIFIKSSLNSCYENSEADARFCKSASPSGEIFCLSKIRWKFRSRCIPRRCMISTFRNRAGSRPSAKPVHGSKQRGFVKWFRFRVNFFPVLIAPENTLSFSALPERRLNPNSQLNLKSSIPSAHLSGMRGMDGMELSAFNLIKPAV